MSDAPVLDKTPISKGIDSALEAIIPGSKNDAWSDVLSPESPLNPGGALRDASKILAAKPGDPTALDPAPTPTNSAPALEAAAANQRRARGRASTILNSGAGPVSGYQSARRTLLGS